MSLRRDVIPAVQPFALAFYGEKVVHIAGRESAVCADGGDVHGQEQVKSSLGMHISRALDHRAASFELDLLHSPAYRLLRSQTL